MKTLPLRLSPGQDLRRAIEAAVAAQGSAAAFVLSGIGSLSQASIRFAAADQPQSTVADLELLTLAGTVAAHATSAAARTSHLHATLSTADGRVFGGHVAYGCIVRTTAELLLGLVDDDWQMSREHDAVSGYDELVVRPALRIELG